MGEDGRGYVRGFWGKCKTPYSFPRGTSFLRSLFSIFFRGGEGVLFWVFCFWILLFFMEGVIISYLPIFYLPPSSQRGSLLFLNVLCLVLWGGWR